MEIILIFSVAYQAIFGQKKGFFYFHKLTIN